MSNQICLKWNSFLNNIATSFESLWEEEGLVDVTLASDGQCLTAHKVILSASSPFFKKVFQTNPCQHPVIILQDVHFRELEALLIFIYKGEVNIEQQNLPALLKAAETLKIRGLSGGDMFAKESYKRFIDLEKSESIGDVISVNKSGDETPKKKFKVGGKKLNNSILEKALTPQLTQQQTNDENVGDIIPSVIADPTFKETDGVSDPVLLRLEMKTEPLEIHIEDFQKHSNEIRKDALERLDTGQQSDGPMVQGGYSKPLVTVIPEARDTSSPFKNLPKPKPKTKQKPKKPMTRNNYDDDDDDDDNDNEETIANDENYQNLYNSDYIIPKNYQTPNEDDGNIGGEFRGGDDENDSSLSSTSTSTSSSLSSVNEQPPKEKPLNFPSDKNPNICQPAFPTHAIGDINTTINDNNLPNETVDDPTSASSTSHHRSKTVGPSYPPFPCPFCDRAYTSWGFRRRHIKAVHTVSPMLNCKWCLQVLPTHAAWRRHVISAHNLSASDAHNGLLILEEAHMVLQIAHPTRLDTLVNIIKQNSTQHGNTAETAPAAAAPVIGQDNNSKKSFNHNKDNYRR